MESQHPPGRWKALLTAFTAEKGLLHDLAIFNRSLFRLNISKINIAWLARKGSSTNPLLHALPKQRRLQSQCGYSLGAIMAFHAEINSK